MSKRSRAPQRIRGLVAAGLGSAMSLPALSFGQSQSEWDTVTNQVAAAGGRLRQGIHTRRARNRQPGCNESVAELEYGSCRTIETAEDETQLRLRFATRTFEDGASTTCLRRANDR